MRTIVSLAVGFWLGRQLYIQYDKEEARQKEQRIKARLKEFLEGSGWAKPEATEQAKDILGV